MPASHLKSREEVFSSQQMQHALYESARAARIILRVDASIIFLLNSASRLVSAAWHGREAGEASISPESPAVRALWASRRAIMWDCRERCTDPEIGAVLESMGLISCLIMPVSLNGSYLGVWM